MSADNIVELISFVKLHSLLSQKLLYTYIKSTCNRQTICTLLLTLHFPFVHVRYFNARSSCIAVWREALRLIMVPNLLKFYYLLLKHLKFGNNKLLVL